MVRSTSRPRNTCAPQGSPPPAPILSRTKPVGVSICLALRVPLKSGVLHTLIPRNTRRIFRQGGESCPGNGWKYSAIATTHGKYL